MGDRPFQKVKPPHDTALIWPSWDFQNLSDDGTIAAHRSCRTGFQGQNHYCYFFGGVKQLLLLVFTLWLWLFRYFFHFFCCDFRGHGFLALLFSFGSCFFPSTTSVVIELHENDGGYLALWWCGAVPVRQRGRSASGTSGTKIIKSWTRRWDLGWLAGFMS